MLLPNKIEYENVFELSMKNRNRELIKEYDLVLDFLNSNKHVCELAKSVWGYYETPEDLVIKN